MQAELSKTTSRNIVNDLQKNVYIKRWIIYTNDKTFNTSEDITTITQELTYKN